MSDELRYYTIAELETMTLEELQAVWELVPTDRQKAYKAAYDREVRTAGAGGSDTLERQLAAQLLERYEQTALVPVGTRWVKAPARVREAAQQNILTDINDTSNQHERVPKIGWLIGVMAVGFMLVMLIVSRGGGDDMPGDITPTITFTPTPEISPTPTPLALEAQDDVIQGGDRERVVAYPVNLQVSLDEDQPPRVWVVQRRTVRAAEWNYDANPDIASFVSGMSVRPVIGVPWSEENAAFFARMDEGTIFTVTMNTGAILRYEFTSQTDVLRSDTAIFRQVSPGLVLLLIGETDDAGLPTGTRTLITASYPPEQELMRGTSVMTEGSVGDTLNLGTTSLTLRDVQPIDTGLAFDLVITTAEEAIDPIIQLIDASGQVHDDEPILPWMDPFSSVPMMVNFRLMDAISGGILMIRDGHGAGVSFRFSLMDTPALQQISGNADVSVQLVSVTHQDDRLTTRLRIYNGQSDALTFTPDDIWLALGYVPDPPGPRTPALMLEPFTLQPEQAIDLTLVWYWAGEPYAALQVGVWRWAIQLVR